MFAGSLGTPTLVVTVLLAAGSYFAARSNPEGPGASTKRGVFGLPVGTVHLAVSGPRGDQVASLRVGGDRAQVRAAAVAAALDLLAGALE